MLHRFFTCFGLIIGSVLLVSCSDDPADTFNSKLKGKGMFIYDDYAPFEGKTLEIFYHVPSDVTANTPICIVFHGNGRDALETRDALVQRSEQRGFIVIVPKFSRDDFPGGDGYILANIFEDGDNPSPSTLNPEEEWTFSVIEPLFDEVVELTSNQNTLYDIIGFSGGAQIAHRYLLFQPINRINRMVASSAGWYTMPIDTIEFPYGRGESPTEGGSLLHFFDFPLYVIVGSLDNDPDAASLRRNPTVDQQGTHRVARAQHFYSEGQNIAQDLQIPFGWQYRSLPNVAHDGELCYVAAADILYR